MTMADAIELGELRFKMLQEGHVGMVMLSILNVLKMERVLGDTIFPMLD